MAAGNGLGFIPGVCVSNDERFGLTMNKAA
jgi:hypothetical protein